MPIQYSYSLASPGGVATGDKVRKGYAFTPRFDPLTRDMILRDSRVDRGNPAIELVLMTLATPKGTYLPDPTLGPNYEVLQKARPNLQATWKAEVESSLARFIPNRILKLTVEVDPPRRNRLVYLVSFVDARAADRLPVELPLATPLAA